jgi:hypothetical protein
MKSRSEGKGNLVLNRYIPNRAATAPSKDLLTALDNGCSLGGNLDDASEASPSKVERHCMSTNCVL